MTDVQKRGQNISLMGAAILDKVAILDLRPNTHLLLVWASFFCSLAAVHNIVFSIFSLQ